MPHSIETDATAVFSAAGTENDPFRSLHHLGGERSAPRSIKANQSVVQASFVDSAPGSGGISQSRRLQRDGGGSFHERRDHRSYSSEWISSPLLESFATFHSALNSVQGVASILENATEGHEEMSCSLPYLGTCWLHDHSGESSVGSTRSTQSSLVSTDTSSASSVETSSLVLDDWDLLKTRSLSADVSSPVPMDNFMPFLFPMDGESNNQQVGHSPHAFPPVVQQYQVQSTATYAEMAVQSPLHTPSAAAQYSEQSAHQMQHTPGHWSVVHPVTSSAMNAVRFASPLSVGYGIASPAMYGAASVSSTSPHHAQHHGQHYHHDHSRVATQVPLHSLYATSSSSSLVTMQASSSTAPVASASSSTSTTIAASPAVPLADIQLLTKLNQCYWKNGRKNLQCFPICPEHNDFYSMKMSNRKHTSVGVCRGPMYTHVFLPAAAPSSSQTKPSRTTGQHMKYEHGVGASSTGGSTYEVFVLGKFERVPQRSDSDELEELLPASQEFTSSSDFEAFRYSCFQAVEMDERRVTTRAAPDVAGLPDHIVRSTWFFLPDVWKVQPMLKKKRKATRSAPAQVFPFCFRVFVYIRCPTSSSSTGGGDDETDNKSAPATYKCIATAASSFFELYSTRTVDRVKRKYWSRSDEETSVSNARRDAMAASMATTPSSTHIAKRASRP